MSETSKQATTGLKSDARRIAGYVAAGLMLVLAAVFFPGKILDINDKDVVLPVVEGYEPFSDEVIDAAKGIPIQESGRVKPLESYAQITLMRFRSQRKVEFEANGETIKIKAMQWMLQTLFRPEVAMQLPIFRIQNIEILETIGLAKDLEADGVTLAKRDFVSFAQLSKRAQELVAMEKSLRQKEESLKEVRGEELEIVEKQILNLAKNFRDYSDLLATFYIARSGVEVPPLPDATAGRRSSASMISGMAPTLLEQLEQAGSADRVNPWVREFMQGIFEVAQTSASGLALTPQRVEGSVFRGKNDDPLAEWLAPGQLLGRVFTPEKLDPMFAGTQLQEVEKLYTAMVSGKDEIAAIEAFTANTQTLAAARGEGKKIGSELFYNKAKWFAMGQRFFFLGLIFVKLMWLKPKGIVGKIFAIGAWAMTSIGLILVLTAIMHRVQIMNRAPIGTLYDTIPFITGGAVFCALFIEFFVRRRAFLSLAPILGILGLFLTFRYELGDGTDTLAPLQAVLDSQFWLLVHVITIVMGYSAGLLTAGISLMYVFGRLFSIDDRQQYFRRDLTRAAYGAACFTLFLTLIGTVLGGVWGADSWGRFWGWDPKENGALMITLWYLFILHARLGGYIKEWGLHICNIIGVAVISFSWWHVNMLGVGLHSYGFSDEEKKAALFTIYYMTLVVCVVAGAFSIWERVERKQARKFNEEPLEA